MIRLEHIGIAVKDLNSSNKLLERLLGKSKYKEELVLSADVKTSFFRVGETKIELLEDNMGNGAIAKFITKKGEGIHHLVFEVGDIEYEIKRLKENGFTILNEQPKRGADNKLICFLHPKSTNGVLVELCQTIKE